ncbi:Rv3235 family protein [Streptomyces sp. CA-294286]|uniref:Rv3235 family protein n=1 Tax=Streptomyces sp. CA-294286 TaxID=3240070 RepID=UPI003D8E9827
MHRTTTGPVTTRRDSRGPGAGRPGTSRPGTTGPSTTRAGTTGPGGTHPSAARARRHGPATPQHRFAELLLAVLSGERPAHSMLNQMLGEAYDQLVLLAPGAPFRTRGGLRPVVRKCGGFEPCPGVIEAFAMIGAGRQLRAMAFRLEQNADRRWRCTAVELGGERVPARI